MEIVYRELDLLKPNPKNPRKATETSILELAESITENPEFFEARPILLSNRTGELVIIGGERRSEAARYLGMEKAPTILLEGLTEAEEDEIMIRDNTHNGKWDTDMLRAWKNEDLEKWAAPKWQPIVPPELNGLDIKPDVLPPIVGEDKPPMDRVLICYKRSEADLLAERLGLDGGLKKVVYEFKDEELI